MTSKRSVWFSLLLPERSRSSRRHAGWQPEMVRTAAGWTCAWVTQSRTGMEERRLLGISWTRCWWSWDFIIMDSWISNHPPSIFLCGPHGRWLMLPAPRNQLKSVKSVPVAPPSIAPFAMNIVQPSFSCPVAMWCAEIANVASNFANALCVVDPSLQPAMLSSWIESPELAVVLLVGEAPWNGSCKLDGCGPVLWFEGSKLMHVWTCMLSAAKMSTMKMVYKSTSLKLFDSILNGKCPAEFVFESWKLELFCAFPFKQLNGK